MRVVVSDDDVLLREGIASLLTSRGFEVVGQTGEPTDLIEQVRTLKPDLVIVDIRMPPTFTTEGLSAARVIRTESPDTAILVLSAHVVIEQATDLISSGERTGYLLKSRIIDVDEFVDTLGRIVRGGTVVDAALVRELVSARHVHEPLDLLSPRAARSARAHGTGTVELGYRSAALRVRRHSRKARSQRSYKARPPRD